MNASHRQLRGLAATTWYLGGFILTLKAASLLIEAAQLNPSSSAFFWSIFLGIGFGIVKARFLFLRSCRRNLMRIQQLEFPKLWGFFRPQFFLFLALMISVGAMMSRWAAVDFTALIIVATIDISIATALLGSSGPFWYQWEE